MTDYQAAVLLEHLAFPEGPRWHQGQFWFTDQHARQVCRVSRQGGLEVMIETDDLPGGLGWLPDGSLLVVYMTRRQIMRWDGVGLELYADLSRHASFHCNDLLVDPAGRIYAGNFGFDLHGGAEQAPAELLLVDTDGSVHLLSDQVIFPNGAVMTPDQRQLIVAETFGHCLTAFSLDQRGRVSGSALWADLGDRTPDGICLDRQGMIWVASPATREVIRVQQGGAIVDRCATIGTPYACTLGGPQRRDLYLCTSETDDPNQALAHRSGRIEYVTVAVGGAGYP
jgi:sugar lactone lactonase YvrE